MNEDIESAQSEDEARPESFPPPLPGGASERAEAAIERWYADHFHAAAVAGRTPITAEEKTSLIAHVSEAITPKE